MCGAARHIAVAVGTRDTLTNAKAIVSVTVGGVPATIVVQGQSTASGDNASCVAGIAVALVPTGFSADVVVTFSEPVLRAAISVYAVDDLASEIPTATATSKATNPTAALDIPAGGIVIAASVAGLQPTAKWGTLTRDAMNNTGLETSAWSSASAMFPTAQVGLPIIAAWSGGQLDPIGVYAVLGRRMVVP